MRIKAAINRFHLPPLGFTLFCAAIAVCCFGLSFWQHQRAQLKASLQLAAQTKADGPLVDLNQTVSSKVADLEWSPAIATGIYAANQFLIDNRFIEHEVGLHVISPLQLGDGRWLLVNRGWIKAPRRRDQIEAPALPQGKITVTGTLVPDAQEAFELGNELPAGNIYQHLKINRWQDTTGNRALPLVLIDRAAADDLVEVPAIPQFKAERSYGYRLQWLALALVAIGGWLAVALRAKHD